MQKSALVVRLSSLGDVVLASSIPGALKNGIPGINITFVTKAQYVPVLKYNPFIDCLIGLENSDLSPSGMLRLISRLRRSEFDYVIDLHGNLRALIISGFAKSGMNVRVRKDGIRRRAFVHGLFRDSYRREHAARTYLKTVAGILGQVPDLAPEVYVGQDEMRSAVSFVGRIDGLKSPVIGVCPGARWPAKMWGQEKFGQLVRLITRELGGTAIVFLDEAGVVTPQGMAIEENDRSVFAFRGELGVVAALLSLGNAVVTNDSGLMHLSCALGKHVVAIFGPTTPELGFSPLGDGHRIVSKGLACQPCSVHGEKKCRLGTLECMESVSVDGVFHALKSVLGLS
ncbi:MAG: glycosyltransferase family 9 protein [Candidatus Eisenbacteria bacterium]|nr:glycosyltransferase family 9 protein [Candidatus Eisenbacteria bacterium]